MSRPAKVVQRMECLSSDQDCPICGERKWFVYIGPKGPWKTVTLLMCWSCDSFALETMELPEQSRVPRRRLEALTAGERGAVRATVAMAVWIVQQEVMRVNEEQKP